MGLFWGAYQISRYRQELETSTRILFTLGILLVPLNLTAALRLISSGMENGLWLGIAAGVMERSLEYAVFFLMGYRFS